MFSSPLMRLDHERLVNAHDAPSGPTNQAIRIVAAARYRVGNRVLDGTIRWIVGEGEIIDLPHASPVSGDRMEAPAPSSASRATGPSQEPS
jgi:hypothetical protein